jgi:uncharacterized protein with PQ loop repeat
MVSITDFFGWVGALVTICFFASPAPKFIELVKKKIQYKEINIIIIIGNYISSVVWLIYGYQISLKQITACFSIGALISLIWIWIYIIYMGKSKKNHALVFTILLSALTFGLYIILAVLINDKTILGEVCFIVCSLSYISPTQLLIKVLNTKDYKYIPIVSAIISAIGYGSWTLFGLFKFNATIIIPNLVGLGFSLAQIILYRVYKNKKPLAEELGNISSSVIGAMKNVVDKTVEIANSIKQENSPNVNATPIKLNNDSTISKDNSTAPGVDNKDINFNTNIISYENNKTDIQMNPADNNNNNGEMNFNTNLEIKEKNNNENNNIASDNNSGQNNENNI